MELEGNLMGLKLFGIIWTMTPEEATLIILVIALGFIGAALGWAAPWLFDLER